jgi:hypothetical protein
MNGALAVPDPEPRLLKANAATPAKLQLLFRPSGKYAASTHFIHVRVPFNFSKLLETPANIFQTYHDYIDKWPEPFRTQVAEVAEISRSCLEDKLNDFSHMLAALPEYKIVRYVNEVAANSDILSFIHKPSDLFLIETSYVYKPDEKTFVLVLHVPLVTPHNLMPLFEFIPLPVYFNFISNVTITPEVGPNNMIAVGHSESYQLLSSSDSQDCNQMGDTYFCKGRNVLLKDLTKTCLGALYLADHSNIQLRCKCPPKGFDENLPRGYLSNRTSPDQDRRQIRRRRFDSGTGDNDQGSQNDGSRRHTQPLDLHLARSHDRRNHSLLGHTFLLLEGLQSRPNPTPISSGTYGANGVQNDGGPHPEMKTRFRTLKNISISFFVFL